MKRRIAAIAVAAVLLTLLALELGARFYLTRFGDDRQKTLYLYSREEINGRLLYRGLSYLNYGLSPAHDEVNSLGYRGPEIAQPKPPETYRVVALGGSTTYGLFLNSWRLAYPHQLQERLRGDFGYENVEVVNAGVPQYGSQESAVNVLLRASDLQPDLLIVYHGINDVGARMGDPDFYDGLNAGRGYWQPPAAPLPPSVLIRFAAAKLGIDIGLSFELGRMFRAPEGFRDCQPDLDRAIPTCANLNMSISDLLRVNPPIYFERNLRNIILLGRAMDAEVLLLTWAYSAHDFPIPGGGGMTSAHLQSGVAEHNAITRDLAEGQGTLFLDLAATMPEDLEYWVNGIHMKAAGTSEMARQIAEYLAASGALEPRSD